MMLALIYPLFMFLQSPTVSLENFKIFGLLDRHLLEEEIVFNYLSTPTYNEPKHYIAVEFQTNKVFDLTKMLCDRFHNQGVAIFTPELPIVETRVINSFARAFRVGHVTLSRAPLPNTFRIRPSLARLVAELTMKYYMWDTFVIFFQYEEDVIELEEEINIRIPSGIYANYRRFSVNSNSETVDNLLIQYQKIGKGRFIVACDLETTVSIMSAAQNLQMLNRDFHYILADIESPCSQLNLTSSGRMNITCFQLLSKRKINDLYTDVSKSRLDISTKAFLNSNEFSKLKMALAHDAYKVIKSAYDRFLHAAPNNYKAPSDPPCLGKEISKIPRYLLYKEIENIRLEGLSGNIQFNKFGQRVDFNVTISERPFSNDKDVKIGTWTDDKGLLLTKAGRSLPSMSSATVRVVTIESKPFTSIKKGRRPEEGNDAYEGFCIDLFSEIAKNLNLSYELHLVADGKFGEELSNGTWNGMIGELMSGKADVALASLTITSERQKVVDFTKPYMDVSVSLMAKIPEHEKSSFAFLIPLHYEIWLCILFCYISVSIVYFITARISMMAWRDGDERYYDQNGFKYTISNCFFLTLGAVLQRGEDMCTKESPFSSRLVGGGWWFFTLIIISSYTANLAAFQTVDRMKTEINSAEDLAAQTEVLYGSIDGGSTKSFFKNSQSGTFQRLYMFMKDRKTFTKSTLDGVQKVRDSDGKFIFLLESTMNEYYNARPPCNTMRIGGNLNLKNYGIATPQGSQLLENFTVQILELGESGFIANTKESWWYEGSECVEKNSKKEVGKDTNALELDSVFGVFYILFAGMALGFSVCIFEFLVFCYRQSRQFKVSFFTVVHANFVTCFKSMFEMNSIGSLSRVYSPIKQTQLPIANNKIHRLLSSQQSSFESNISDCPVLPSKPTTNNFLPVQHRPNSFQLAAVRVSTKSSPSNHTTV